MRLQSFLLVEVANEVELVFDAQGARVRAEPGEHVGELVGRCGA